MVGQALDAAQQRDELTDRPPAYYHLQGYPREPPGYPHGGYPSDAPPIPGQRSWCPPVAQQYPGYPTVAAQGQYGNGSERTPDMNMV